MPTTRPDSPTSRANSREKLPGPQATSRTVSPRESPISRRAIRTSSAIPGPVTPLAIRASAGPPPALVDRRHDARVHQVLGTPCRDAAVARHRRSCPHRAGRGSRRPATICRASRNGLRQQRRRPLGGAAPAASLGHQTRGPSPRGSPLCWASSSSRGDLALALGAGRVIRGKRLDQAPDPVADLQREVGRRGAGQRADVLDRDLVAGLRRSGRSASLIALFARSWLRRCPAGTRARPGPAGCRPRPGRGRTVLWRARAARPPGPGRRPRSRRCRRSARRGCRGRGSGRRRSPA